MTNKETDVQVLQRQLEQMTLERDQAHMLLDTMLSNKHNSVFLVDLESGLLADRFSNGRSTRNSEKWHIQWNTFLEHILRGVAPEEASRLRQQFDVEGLQQLEMGCSSPEVKVSAYVHPVTSEVVDEQFWYTIKARTIVLNGKFWGMIAIIDDTEELLNRQMQQEVFQDAMDRAEKASESNNAFLFHMSHDIRTTMNAILGFASLAKRNNTNPRKVEEFLGKLETAGEFLIRLLNDILDMVRIESGKVFLNECSCNILKGAENMDTILQKELESKKLDLEVKIADVQDIQVCCDPLRLNQILMNLISNAIRFSKHGGSIYFQVSQLPCDRDGYGRFEWRVKDTGIGMSAQFLPHIFEPFERENPSGETKAQGTGLGMSITKMLVELMEGDIQVSSKLGQGTEVIVTMDLQICPQEEQRPVNVEEMSQSRDFCGKRILLAEDNELNCEIAQELLESVGFAVETAGDGSIAVEKLRQAGPGYYDLILMDIQMPYMDGYMATQTIRKMEDSRLANIPIVAMTANAFEQDRRKALDMGMNEYMAKPFDLSRLLEILQNNLFKEENFSKDA